MIPVRKPGVATGNGPQAPVRLSGQPPVATVARSPARGAAFDIGALSLYRVFTPTRDMLLGGLNDTLAHIGPLRAYVWRNGDASSPIGIGNIVAPTPGTPYQSMLANPVPLTAGVAYLIGWIATSGNVLTENSNPALTYTDLSLGAESRYATTPAGYPDRTLSGGFYPVTFDLLLLIGALLKQVTGPLDPGDFPVVKAAADLPVNAAAILDPGTSAPRLIRKRSDGSVWYGAPFTNVP